MTTSESIYLIKIKCHLKVKKTLPPISSRQRRPNIDNKYQLKVKIIQWQQIPYESQDNLLKTNMIWKSRQSDVIIMPEIITTNLEG